MSRPAAYFQERPLSYDTGIFANHQIRRAGLQADHDIDRFLASVEKRAYRMALVAVGHREDALDILQDTMCKLVEKYARKPQSDWPALFYTILQSRIRDWYRREAVRNRFRVWFGREDDAESDILENMADGCGNNPDTSLQAGRFMDSLERAVRDLPLRQQQAFMLRAFEEFDVKETASIMGCSEGSVKTHFSRATSALREKLGDKYL